MKINNKNNPVIVECSKALSGIINTPSDKSISHRALILGSLCIGKTKIHNLLLSEDIMSTISALEQFGANINVNKESGITTVHGFGIGGLLQPSKKIYLGNSGTSVRLLIGLMSSCDVCVEFEGDQSLSRRPMGRVLEPLKEMGLEIISNKTNNLPLKLQGTALPIPINHKLLVPSAQIKSALMLSALNIRGRSTIIETIKTRDHTEKLFAYFDADIEVKKNEVGDKEIVINGQKRLSRREIDIPGDPSSAAFFVVAALISKGSKLRIKNIMMNPTRSVYIDYLISMGAKIDFINKYSKCGEEVLDIEVTASELKGITTSLEDAPSLIDEFLILSVAAAYAKGESKFCGISELKVKESDRLEAIINMLTSAGVECRTQEDNLIIRGNGEVSGGSSIMTNYDHRVAMSALILGLGAKSQIRIDDISPIATSFPDFMEIYNRIGGNFHSG
tara:strand:+ start:5986 stop:7329 length:1344 start_codon:yes stop_codon:yes gene_type:complete